jgi:hypothetical protein
MKKGIKGHKGFVLLANGVALILLVITASCSINPLAQQAVDKQVHNTPTINMPTLPEGQGLFESCNLLVDTQCIDRLKQMAAAGFKLVLNYDQLEATSGQEIEYAEQAHLLGMKVIWAMNDPAFWNGTNLLTTYQNLAYTCSCSDNAGFIHYFVNLVKNLPATWGYYVGDEVAQRDYDKMKAYADLIKQLDPSHPRLIASGEDSTSLGSNIKPFIDTADVLGSDIYPIGKSEPISTIGRVARNLQAIANANGKQTAMVLQSFSVAQYGACSPPPGCARFPTKDELRQMLNQVLQNAQPQFILWYSYFDILKSDNPSLYWTNLSEAAGVNPTASESR